MKALTLVALSSLLLIFSLSSTAQKTKVKAKPASMKDMPMQSSSTSGDNDHFNGSISIKSSNTTSMGDNPYTPSYSNQVEMGDPALVNRIMSMYKDYETNAFKLDDAFADTAVVVLANGLIFRGKTQIQDAFKQHRGEMTSFSFDPLVVMPVKLGDRNENWVLVWDNSTATGKDGTKIISYTHEDWRINKDGKVDLMRQYEMQSTPPKQ